jgi:hypothetical protein
MFIKEVNSLSHVTHNYLREHVYNVWFTLIAPTQEDILKDLRDLEDKSGVKILNLPAVSLYKIKVDFNIAYH